MEEKYLTFFPILIQQKTATFYSAARLIKARWNEKRFGNKQEGRKME
jgi:hypothetical protein